MGNILYAWSCVCLMLVAAGTIEGTAIEEQQNEG